tara:strand:- start:10374 stop:10781 length:408 start_codon:yes stop_codon:yes gene_type:complete
MRKANKFEYIYWEDYINGMYDSPNNIEQELKLAYKIFNDFSLFEFLCKEVINNWKISCIENLTNKSMNRIAWLGQSALNINHFIKERTTKKIWKTLDSEVKNKLNKIAYKTILNYEKRSKGVLTEMGENLFEWDS